MAETASTTIKRKLYKRGSSFETTIPMPLLFAIDKDAKHEVLFKYDSKTDRWYVEFEKAGERKEVARKRGVVKKRKTKRGVKR